MLSRDQRSAIAAGPKSEQGDSSKSRLLTEIAMEVGADDDQPFPSPYPSKKGWWARRAKG